MRPIPNQVGLAVVERRRERRSLQNVVRATHEERHAYHQQHDRQLDRVAGGPAPSPQTIRFHAHLRGVTYSRSRVTVAGTSTTIGCGGLSAG